MAVGQTTTIPTRTFIGIRTYKPRVCWNCGQTWDEDAHSRCPYCGSPKQKPPQG
jgi:rubrerythrin